MTKNGIKMLAFISLVFTMAAGCVFNAPVTPRYSKADYDRYESLRFQNKVFDNNRHHWFENQSLWRSRKRLYSLPNNKLLLKKYDAFFNTNNTTKVLAKLKSGLCNKVYYSGRLANDAKHLYVIELITDRSKFHYRIDGKDVTLPYEYKWTFYHGAGHVFANLDGLLALKLDDNEIECAMNVILQHYYDSLIDKYYMKAINIYVFDNSKELNLNAQNPAI